MSSRTCLRVCQIVLQPCLMKRRLLSLSLLLFFASYSFESTLDYRLIYLAIWTLDDKTEQNVDGHAQFFKLVLNLLGKSNSNVIMLIVEYSNLNRLIGKTVEVTWSERITSSWERERHYYCLILLINKKIAAHLTLLAKLHWETHLNQKLNAERRWSITY